MLVLGDMAATIGRGGAGEGALAPKSRPATATVHEGRNVEKETMVRIFHRSLLNIFIIHKNCGYLPPSRSPPPAGAGVGAGAGALRPPNKSSPPNCKAGRVRASATTDACGDRVGSIAGARHTITLDRNACTAQLDTVSTTDSPHCPFRLTSHVRPSLPSHRARSGGGVWRGRGHHSAEEVVGGRGGRGGGCRRGPVQVQQSWGQAVRARRMGKQLFLLANSFVETKVLNTTHVSNRLNKSNMLCVARTHHRRPQQERVLVRSLLRRRGNRNRCWAPPLEPRSHPSIGNEVDTRMEGLFTSHWR